MKIKLFETMLQLLNDERGNLSLSGGEPAPAPIDSGVGVGDSGVSNEASTEPVGGDVEPALDPSPEPVGDSVFPADLSEEIKNDPSLKVFLDKDGKFNTSNLMKSYVHAQKKMGEAGLRVPDKHATPEQWAAFRNEMRPEDIAKYEVNNSLADGLVLNEEMFGAFKKAAHDAGLTTSQAQNVLDWYNQSTTSTQKSLNEEHEVVYKEQVNGLKAEWGEGFDKEMNLAQRALKEFASESDIKYLKDKGLDGDVTLIRMFNKVGKGLMEDKFEQESHGTFGYTKHEAEKEINQIYGDKNSPYYDKDHPQHDQLVQKMLTLHEATMVQS